MVYPGHLRSSGRRTQAVRILANAVNATGHLRAERAFLPAVDLIDRMREDGPAAVLASKAARRRREFERRRHHAAARAGRHQRAGRRSTWRASPCAPKTAARTTPSCSAAARAPSTPSPTPRSSTPCPSVRASRRMPEALEALPRAARRAARRAPTSCARWRCFPRLLRALALPLAQRGVRRRRPARGSSRWSPRRARAR